MSAEYVFPVSEEAYAKDLLASQGYTGNFEDVSYHDYEGTVMYCAQNSEGKWGSVSYYYGTCEMCGAISSDEDAKERLDDSFEGSLDNKPSAAW